MARQSYFGMIMLMFIDYGRETSPQAGLTAMVLLVNGTLIIICAMLIGYLGRDHRFGWWFYFLVSLILTPIAGVVLLLITRKREPAGS